MRLLLIEDERKVADFVARGLRAERFAVDVAADGATGWDLASQVDYDLIILDLMPPRPSSGSPAPGNNLFGTARHLMVSINFP